MAAIEPKAPPVALDAAARLSRFSVAAGTKVAAAKLGGPTVFTARTMYQGPNSFVFAHSVTYGPHFGPTGTVQVLGGADSFIVFKVRVEAQKISLADCSVELGGAHKAFNVFIQGQGIDTQQTVNAEGGHLVFALPKASTSGPTSVLFKRDNDAPFDWYQCEFTPLDP